MISHYFRTVLCTKTLYSAIDDNELQMFSQISPHLHLDYGTSLSSSRSSTISTRLAVPGFCCSQTSSNTVTTHPSTALPTMLRSPHLDYTPPARHSHPAARSHRLPTLHPTPLPVYLIRPTRSQRHTTLLSVNRTQRLTPKIFLLKTSRSKRYAISGASSASRYADSAQASSGQGINKQ